jgi:hypothetical protein
MISLRVIFSDPQRCAPESRPNWGQSLAGSNFSEGIACPCLAPTGSAVGIFISAGPLFPKYFAKYLTIRSSSASVARAPRPAMESTTQRQSGCVRRVSIDVSRSRYPEHTRRTNSLPSPSGNLTLSSARLRRGDSTRNQRRMRQIIPEAPLCCIDLLSESEQAAIDNP